MTDNQKTYLYKTFLSIMLTIIIALLSYIGYGIQEHLDRVEAKIEKYPTKEYVDQQDDYLRLHIVQSHKTMNDKLDLYIDQNNRFQTLLNKQIK